MMALVMLWQNQTIAAAADMSSYANIAKNVRAGHYAELSNPYWSPLYPGFLSFFFSVPLTIESLRAAFLGSLLIEHLLFIFSLLFFATGIFQLRSFLQPRLAFPVFASAVFFGMALYLKFAVFFTPDHLLSVTILFALGILCRLLLSGIATASCVACRWLGSLRQAYLPSIAIRGRVHRRSGASRGNGVYRSGKNYVWGGRKTQLRLERKSLPGP
jgi:hypothetical protein